MKFKIAVVQFRIKQFDKEDNLKRIETFIKLASEKKSKVILFPEDFIYGPIGKKEKFVDFKGELVSVFKSLAKKYSIDIVAGSIIEGAEEGWYNTTYYIDSNGKVLAKYRKINLWIYERKNINQGRDIVVFKTSYGKVGLINCWDLSSPEIVRSVMKKGARVVFCPSYWLEKDARYGHKYDVKAVAKGIDAWCVARAFENGIILAYSNGAGDFSLGKKYKDKLVGHSQIAVPFKGSVSKFDHNEEGMLIQEVDTKILTDSERSFNIKKDIKNRKYFGILK